MKVLGNARRTVGSRALSLPLGEGQGGNPSALNHSMSEFAERFSNRIALLAWADQCSVEHLAFRIFSQAERPQLPAFLDQICAGRSDTPLSLAPAEMALGLDRWIPPQDWQQRDAQWAVFLKSCPGDIIAERRLEGARRLRVPWRVNRDGEVGLYPFWDISLSEGETLYGPAPFRIHIAFMQRESENSRAMLEIQGAVNRLLNAAPLELEGVFDFLVEGEQPFLVDAWMGDLDQCRLPYCASFDEPNQTVCALIWALDLSTGVPQPGALRSLQARERAESQVVFRPSVERDDFENFSHEGCAPSVEGVLGVLTVRSHNREEGLQNLQDALKGLQVRGGVGSSHISLAEVFDHEFVREGWVHHRFLQEDWVPTRLMPPPDEWAWLPEILALSERSMWRSGALICGGRRFLCSAFEGDEKRLRRGDVCPAADAVTDDCWRVYFSTGPALIRFEVSVGTESTGPQRVLRALTQGRVAQVDGPGSDSKKDEVCWLYSAGTWIPHRVASTVGPHFRWQVSEGQGVQAGDVLGVVLVT